MASTSKYWNEDNVLGILNDSDECVLSDSSDDDHEDCDDDIAVPDPAVGEENSEVEEEREGHSLGDADYSIGFMGGHTQL
jgi:hypothetical protein